MAQPLDLGRRGLVTLATAGALFLPAACAKGGEQKQEQGEKEVTAVEDLMREHGILRRILLVYDEVAVRLQHDDRAFDAGAVADAAMLFRDFGEGYHERRLEEAYIFPQVKKAGGPAAALADVLRAQHDRGREITAYVLDVCKGGLIGVANTQPLASALASMVVMYENHAAREDTILFPAWKAALSEHELDEMGDKFEDIEKATFGGDGFDKGVKQIEEIEDRLGYADLAKFTAPPPPRPAPATATKPAG